MVLVLPLRLFGLARSDQVDLRSKNSHLWEADQRAHDPHIIRLELRSLTCLSSLRIW